MKYRHGKKTKKGIPFWIANHGKSSVHKDWQYCKRIT